MKFNNIYTRSILLILGCSFTIFGAIGLSYNQNNGFLFITLGLLLGFFSEILFSNHLSEVLNIISKEKEQKAENNKNNKKFKNH